MKIRNRLALFYAILSMGMLLIWSAIILYTATRDRKKEFYNTLRKEAITKVNVLLDARVDAQTLQTIYRNNRNTLDEVEVAIYNEKMELVYHDAVDIDVVKETPGLLQEIEEKGAIYFEQEKWDILGLKYAYAGQTYLITAAAYDAAGYAKLQYLYQVILWGLLAIGLITIIASNYIARRALEPISDMAEKAKHISIKNLDLRLPATKEKDELHELAESFNTLLNRLEKAYEEEKSFISHAAHELNTPLSAMLAQLQISLGQERDNMAYRNALEQTEMDVQKLKRLVNGLMDLAKAGADPSQISMQPLRLDEVLMEARSELLKTNPEYKVDLQILGVEALDEPPMIKGNTYLLVRAFVNLMDNACKFSTDKKALVQLNIFDHGTLAEVADNGPGIHEDEIEKIFIPFYRSFKGLSKTGTGIGLAFTRKVMTLHQASMEVCNRPEGGALFRIKF